LLLFQQQAETQPMVEFAQRLRVTIRDELASPAEFYQESLDLDRFRGSDRASPLAGYFASKYRGFGIDAVVPVGARALQFAVHELRDVFPNVPIVFALNAVPQLDTAALPGNVTGRFATASRYTPTLAMARALQPDAERIVVISGSGPSDSISASAVLSAVAAFGDTLPLTVLDGLTLNALLGKLHELSRRSIVIFANFREDRHGQVYEPLDIVGSMARASAAPIYTNLRSYVGEGFVGGSALSFDDEGAQTGRLIVRVLRRRPRERMPPVEVIGKSFVADWRQLQRWGLSEQRLPPGTEVVFREPTWWARHRTVILLALGIMSAQAFLIGSLLLERRRRKRAQFAAEESRRQVAHVGRVALISELGATISHELRQPLTAIRVNAQAGARLLADTPLDLSELREIFGDIVADDERAVAVIEGARKLLRKDEPAAVAVDLNQICRDAVHLLHHEAELRNARLGLALAPAPPMVVGDPVQLEQLVLNLALNGLEAASASKNGRFVVVSTASRGGRAEVAVHDSGPGIAADVQPRLFESFYSTKPEGLGLGLVIVRSIVERHGGRVDAENHSMGGAVFRVVLPAAIAPVLQDVQAGRYPFANDLGLPTLTRDTENR